MEHPNGFFLLRNSITRGSKETIWAYAYELSTTEFFGRDEFIILSVIAK